MVKANALSLWLLRLLLAALLLFGSEILLWTTPLSRSVGDWLLLVPGYIALAAVMLDLAARYRIRHVYDVMTQAAIYGLLAGLLLNPQTALATLPNTLVTRVLGGHTLLGLEMFGLFLALTGGQIRRYRRLLLIASVWLGFFWGVWVHWSPIITSLADPITDPTVPLMTMLAYGAAGLLLVLVMFVVTMRRTVGERLNPSDLRLSVIEWGVVLVTLISLFLVRVIQLAVDSGALVLMAVLATGCLATLWFRRLDKSKTLLDNHLPVTPLAWRWIITAIILFFGVSIVAYSLPLVDFLGISQYSLMTLGFAAVGIGWLPLIAMVLSIEALDRQTRTSKL